MPDQQYLDLLVYYLRERHLIFERRQSGQPAPWTEDSIFQTYKFTNVLRSNDRTTRWAIANWYSQHRDATAEAMAINCAIFRYFGTIEFATELGWQDEWNPEHVLRVADRMYYQSRKLFTAAYVITNGGMSDRKQAIVVNHYLDPFARRVREIVAQARTNRWQNVSEHLQTFPGFGPFMSKEVCLDMILTPLLEDCEDRLTWSPAGPGAIRGLNRIYGRDLDKNLPQDRALVEMKELLAYLANTSELTELNSFPRIGVDFGVTDVQFALCELDKYSRVHMNEGKRPKAKFKPSSQPLP